MHIDKTRAIVLNTLRYGDHKVIITLYTEEFGRRTYLVTGLGSKRTKARANLFQPCFPLELTVIHKPNREIQEIREGNLLHPIQQLALDPIKRSIAVFIAEILYRFIREEEANHPLFEFALRSVLWLEQATDGVPNFHLFFLVQLTRFTGFYPSDNYSDNSPYFDLLSGRFEGFRPPHAHFLPPGAGKVLFQLLQGSSDQLAHLRIDNQDRRFLLLKLVEYFRLHFDIPVEIRSMEVLNEVFFT